MFHVVRMLFYTYNILKIFHVINFLTIGFRAAVCLFNYQSKMTDVKMWQGYSYIYIHKWHVCGQKSGTSHLMLSEISLLLYRPTATWNLFVLYNKIANVVSGDIIFASVLQLIHVNTCNCQYKCVDNSAYQFNRIAYSTVLMQPFLFFTYHFLILFIYSCLFWLVHVLGYVIQCTQSEPNWVILTLPGSSWRWSRVCWAAALCCCIGITLG